MNRTKIDWAHYTWNPIVGCSFGCPWCYARRFAERGLGEYGTWPKGQRFTPRFLPERLREPLVVRKASRIFLGSMGDVFGPEIQPNWLDEILARIAQCRHHRFLVLTKRPGRIQRAIYEGDARELGSGDSLSNLWLGISVTNQDDAMVRIPALLATTKHGGRFVSVEPMLGPVCLTPWLRHGGLDWVIIGAQTGPGALAVHVEQVQALVMDCGVHGVPVFVKGNVPARCYYADQDYHTIPWPREYPEGLRVREED